MEILVTFAVDWEFRPWRKLREFHPSPGDDRVYHAQVDGDIVTAVLTGVGAENASRTLRACLNDTPDLCIASGLAGGLQPKLRSGDVLAARTVRGTGPSESLVSDERLFSLALQSGAKAAESFVSAGKVVRTAKEKTQLGKLADAVDMESYAVTEEMARQGVPSVAIRSIADELELNLMCDFDRALDNSGRVRIAQVLGQVARAPKEIWPLVKFGVITSRAASALTHYLDAYVSFLSRHRAGLDLRAQQVVQ